MKIEPEVLFDKLAGMESPEEIRLFCRSQEVTGVRQDEHSCVLAQLFRRDTTAVQVRVAGHIQWAKSYLEVEDFESGDWGEQRECTQTLADFIRLFDDGMFRELIAPTDEDEYYS